jgi:hypothetical protein
MVKFFHQTHAIGGFGREKNSQNFGSASTAVFRMKLTNFDIQHLLTDAGNSQTFYVILKNV